MIQLYELLKQKELLDLRIEELEGVLCDSFNKDFYDEYMQLIELRQNKVINIISANAKSTITVSGTEIPISIAIVLRDGLFYKVEMISKIINRTEDVNLLKELNRVRERLHSEYSLLDMAITNNDIGVSIGDK
jgi:hypothetical protein